MTGRWTSRHPAGRTGWEPCEGGCGVSVLCTVGRDGGELRRVMLDRAADVPLTAHEHTPARCRALRAARAAS